VIPGDSTAGLALEIPGFVPATYLAGPAGEMSLSREAFVRRWLTGEPLAVVSDRQWFRSSPAGIAPPSYVLVQTHGKRVLRNVPAGCHGTRRVAVTRPVATPRRSE